MCLINGKDFTYIPNASLKNFCTFRVGGKAKHLIIARNNKALLQVYLKCKAHNIKYKIIGCGANLLFDDNGYNGVIIVNETNTINFDKNLVLAEGGVNLTNLIIKCLERSLGGFEKLVGIPSTVGGATVNNTGALGVAFSNFIDYVECFDTVTGNVVKLNNTDCKFSYRNSIFKNGRYIILCVKLKLSNEDGKVLKDNVKYAIERKRFSQPLNRPSAGSVFKRTDVIPAKLIDELGLKGLRVGDAIISPKHAGFIVNLGNATSKDILNLIEIIKTQVFEVYGERLQEEIEYVEP